MAWHTRLAQEVPAWAKRGEDIERRVSELHLSYLLGRHEAPVNNPPICTEVKGVGKS